MYFFVKVNKEGRYYVAVNQDKRIVAMTGLSDSKNYCGLEIDWTCWAKEYEHRGIITNMPLSFWLYIKSNKVVKRNYIM